MITREVSVSGTTVEGPTLMELKNFIEAAEVIGADMTRKLRVDIAKGFSNERDSEPSSFKLTAMGGPVR